MTNKIDVVIARGEGPGGSSYSLRIHEEQSGASMDIFLTGDQLAHMITSAVTEVTYSGYNIGKFGKTIQRTNKTFVLNKKNTEHAAVFAAYENRWKDYNFKLRDEFAKLALAAELKPEGLQIMSHFGSQNGHENNYLGDSDLMLVHYTVLSWT